ncbi:hypothetical protein GCM10018785_46870 [Streptomyces longispororuber]|uniref:Uncharacterized protein n=1 Tax=Streptomyces longispororuber TaxID=68230 RepID=A0A918ZXN9_9ACTN|nr:hypothetical protein GCM10018785_46870 [Streptomyces longispororuber]
MIAQDNPGASDAELLRRDRLAHELMFLGRGNRVVYAGDEQGFTGSGGDNAARQPLFATDAPAYRDDDQIGTDRTHARDAYDTRHPLYRAVARLSELTRRHPALRDGVFTDRYPGPADGPGVYAYSRTDPRKRVEYVVAHNNATGARTVRIPTGAAHRRYTPLYGTNAPVRSGADRGVTVTVPALSSVVLQADGPLPGPDARPRVTLRAPEEGATGTVELTADVDGGELNRVVFAARQGHGPWQVLGTADHAPYKVTQHLDPALPESTALCYKAVVVDSGGRAAHALATSSTGRPPSPVRPALQRAHAVVHYRRPDGDYEGWRLRTGAGGAPAAFTGRDAYGAFAWVPLAKGATSLTYTVEKDVPDDESLDIGLYGNEGWRVAGESAYLTPALGGALGLDLAASRVRWLDEDTVVRPAGGAGVASRQLVYAPRGGITLRDGALSDEGHWLRLRPAGPGAGRRPGLADGETVLTVDPRDRDRVPDARRARQLLATERGADGALIGATGVRQGN